MKTFLRGLYRSFPVQLVLLHFKKFQLLLLFWFVLFSTVNGSFMKTFGADSLYLAPEYMGNVSALAAVFVGMSIGIFIMSWNITTFILFSRHFRFLATTSNPFLKYCINNGVLPLLFLIFYFTRAIQFDVTKELMTPGQVFWMVLGFLSGLALIIIISLYYFFRADKTIIRQLTPVISNPQLFKAQFKKQTTRLNESRLIKVEWYLSTVFKLKKVRDVSHYSREFIETIFSRHHFAAVISIFIAFICLVVMGFWLDNPLCQLPAAAGITVFFAILIAVSGAFSYFLQSWSIPFLIVLFIITNILFKYEIIDPSNKAYGLNYKNTKERPVYSADNLLSLCTPEKIQRDKLHMISILENWKKRQSEEKPLMFVITTSGGGNRSAVWTMNVLQRLDSLMQGDLMKKTVLITGASGGMLGATYFRELSRLKQAGQTINLQDRKYADDISNDLLNPLFTSFIARDLAAPAQRFKVGEYDYIKDRGYAFEQKLSENTRGVLNKQLYEWYDDEKNGRIPMMLFNSVVTRDGRKMIISTQPTSFLMRPAADSMHLADADPDAIDYGALFARQNPLNLRMLTALRMNATFPYVLPNVWLPTEPVIDVMDAGLRDNYGNETALRFIQIFQQWIKNNTSGVVFIHIRDRKTGGWEYPYESTNITELVTKPMLLLEYNWYKMQEYNQNDLLSLSQTMLGNHLHRFCFMYTPEKSEARAALNFHLTKSEKKDIAGSIENAANRRLFDQFGRLIKKTDVLTAR